MNERLIEKAKKAIEKGREKGRVVDVSVAFEKYPSDVSIAEVRKENPEYFQIKEIKT